jgi:WD40 repeat protein
VRIWDFQRRFCGRLEGLNNAYSICVNENNTRIYTGSDDGTVRIWDAKWLNCLVEFKASEGECITRLELIGDLLYTTSGQWRHRPQGINRRWDAKTGEPLQTSALNDEYVTCKFVRDYIYKNLGNGTIEIWCAHSGVFLKKFEGFSKGFVGYLVLGDRLYASMEDGLIKILCIRTEKQVGSLQGHTERLCEDPSIVGNCIVTRSLDNTIKIWDIASEECLQTLPNLCEKDKDDENRSANDRSRDVTCIGQTITVRDFLTPQN